MRSGSSEVASTATRLVLGAGECVELIVRDLDGSELDLPLEDMAHSTDRRLRRRCLFPLPGLHRDRDGSLHKHSEQVLSQIDLIPTALIVDRASAIYYSYLNEHPGPFLASEPSDVRHYLSNFEAHWTRSFESDAADTIYDRAEEFARPDGGNRIAVASHEAWTRLIRELAKSPELLHHLDSRKFEELVAELLDREGLEVRLTPQSRDGGRDILAFYHTPVGKHLYLVECKRTQATSPVGVYVVRQLYGVVTQERATAGLVVTTSRFTSPAIAFAVALEYQIGLKDYEAVKHWLRSHASA